MEIIISLGTVGSKINLGKSQHIQGGGVYNTTGNHFSNDLQDCMNNDIHVCLNVGLCVWMLKVAITVCLPVCVLVKSER